LERDGTPYYLIAYSMGARVVTKAFDRYPVRLRNLKGVFFLGAAIPVTTRIKAGVLPSGLKIVNYHSPTRDVVLLSYENLERVAAGGADGFDDANVF
jgi:hypothetical protein